MSCILETWRWPQKAKAAEDCLVDGHQWLRYGASCGTGPADEALIETPPICGHCGAVLESSYPLPCLT